MKGRPFYFQPPWNILFEIRKLGKISPWEIKISFLLSSFLEEMAKNAELDFRASGVALDSSANIYLMKSKLLLKLEEAPKLPETRYDFIPPPLILPLRYELTTTTIENLLQALDDTLVSEKAISLRVMQKPVILLPVEIPSIISAYLVEMEEQIEILHQKMLLLAESESIVTYSRIIEGLESLEGIRTFVILLFMAQRGNVTLWQEEDLGEIFITIPGGQ